MTTRPVITRVSAVHRNPAHQWWVDHKRVAKPVSIAVGVILILVVVIIGIVDLIV